MAERGRFGKSAQHYGGGKQASGDTAREKAIRKNIVKTKPKEVKAVTPKSDAGRSRPPIVKKKFVDVDAERKAKRALMAKESAIKKSQTKGLQGIDTNISRRINRPLLDKSYADPLITFSVPPSLEPTFEDDTEKKKIKKIADETTNIFQNLWNKMGINIYDFLSTSVGVENVYVTKAEKNIIDYENKVRLNYPVTAFETASYENSKNIVAEAEN